MQRKDDQATMETEGLDEQHVKSLVTLQFPRPCANYGDPGCASSGYNPQPTTRAYLLFLNMRSSAFQSEPATTPLRRGTPTVVSHMD